MTGIQIGQDRKYHPLAIHNMYQIYKVWFWIRNTGGYIDKDPKATPTMTGIQIGSVTKSNPITQLDTFLASIGIRIRYGSAILLLDTSIWIRIQLKGLRISRYGLSGLWWRRSGSSTQCRKESRVTLYNGFSFRVSHQWDVLVTFRSLSQKLGLSV